MKSISVLCALMLCLLNGCSESTSTSSKEIDKEPVKALAKADVNVDKKVDKKANEKADAPATSTSRVYDIRDLLASIPQFKIPPEALLQLEVG